LGTWGTLGCFSFFPTKALGALGDAGLVVTDDAALGARCRALRSHGVGPSGEHVAIGGNFRMDAIQAAILGVRLRGFDARLRARREHAAAYDRALCDVAGVVPLARGPLESWNGALYTVRVLGGRRAALVRHLAERGVETRVYYPRPLHLEPALQHLGIESGALPRAERAAAEVLSLPVYGAMPGSHRDAVVDAIRDFFR
jgi:dTDP-4-amino-4,6-dideoxygalactose transaminase